MFAARWSQSSQCYYKCFTSVVFAFMQWQQHKVFPFSVLGECRKLNAPHCQTINSFPVSVHRFHSMLFFFLLSTIAAFVVHRLTCCLACSTLCLSDLIYLVLTCEYSVLLLFNCFQCCDSLAEAATATSATLEPFNMKTKVRQKGVAVTWQPNELQVHDLPSQDVNTVRT